MCLFRMFSNNLLEYNMFKDYSHKIFKINRMKSRFDNVSFRGDDSASSDKRIHFTRILTTKKRSSIIRLTVLLVAVLWAYHYFTSIN